MTPAKLLDLVEPIGLVDGAARLSAVIRQFSASAEIYAVAIVEQDVPLGILTRTRVMEMAATSNVAVNRRLCVSDLVEVVPQLDGQTPVTNLILDRHPDDFSSFARGVLVLEGQHVLGLLSLPALLRAVARERVVMGAEKNRPAPAALPPVLPQSSRLETTPALSAETVLGTLAHEIRTPLTGMMGLAEILQNRLREPDLKDMAETIVRSGEALNRLLSDALDFAALQAGQLHLSPEPADMADLVRDLRRLWGPMATGKGLGFNVALQTQLGSVIEVDLGRLRQVANNLISNALKFTETGRIDVLFTIKRPVGAALQLCLDVRDTGAGLSHAQKKTLFNFFEKGDAVSDEPGWGLGLSISKALSRHLGGGLEVTDNAAQGTVFSLSVPVQPVERTASSIRRRGRLPSGKFSLGNILLVEDHDACAMIFRTAIEKAGWQVDHAKSLDEAAQYLERHVYQAVLTDLHLLDGTGLSLIEALRDRSDLSEDLAIIALTGDTRTAATSLALAHGADRVIAKPVRAPELVAQLAEAVLRKGHAGRLRQEPKPKDLAV